MLGARVKTLGHKMAGLFKSPQCMYTWKNFMWKPLRWKTVCSCGKNSFPVSAISRSEQDHRKGEPAQITSRTVQSYCKIPKISPGTYIFQRPFLRVYFWRGLSTEGIYCFCFVLLCIWEQFPSTSPQGGYIWRGDWTEGFLCYEFGGLIFGGTYTCIFQNFTVYVNSPKYGTDLPLSCIGHKISQIKWTFELFCTLHVHVVCNLAHFSQMQTFFIQCQLLGHFCTYLVTQMTKTILCRKLIVCTSCKTSYNVPSQSHVIIWQLDQFAGRVGAGGWRGGCVNIQVG